MLDDTGAALAGKSGDVLLDAMVFAGYQNPVRDVMAGGRWVVREGRHTDEEEVLRRYRAALAELTA